MARNQPPPANHSYAVLTEHETAHHVVVRHPGSPWLRCIATFVSRGRAEGYCKFEQECGSDGHEDDDVNELPPGVVALPNPIAARPHAHTPGSALTAGAAKTLADEILAALPAMMEKHPKGPTVKAIAVQVDADEFHVRQACRQLSKDRRAVLARRPDSSAYHLVPIDHLAIPPELTPTQNAVFEALKATADVDGFSEASRRDLCDAAAVSKGNIEAVIGALRTKGYVEEIEKGSGSRPSIFRLFLQERKPS